MHKSIAAAKGSPASDDELAEILAFEPSSAPASPLDELIRQGAQQMLQAAINAEIEAFLREHADRRDDRNRRLVVKNGTLPAREILTGAGPLKV